MAAPALTRALALIAALVLACTSTTTTPPSASPTLTFTATRTEAPSSGSPTRPPTPTPSPRIGPAVVANVKVLLSGLEIPWAVELAPDGRLFFTERPGRVRVARFDGSGATLEPQPWATVSVRAVPKDEEAGLLGLALDPEFATNGFVYLYYSYLAQGRITNRVTRMRDANGVGVEEKVLLDGIAGSADHDGGRIKFGPDGKLWVTTGDGEVPSRAQDRNSPNGKVLRLNKDGTAAAGNPIDGNDVFTLGHRNVQGIAFQPVSQAVFVTEHGPSAAFPNCCNDEVNRLFPAANYGWPTVFGQAQDPRFVSPLATSGRTETWAPSGATFLTHPGPLYGSFVFATLRGEHLHRIVFVAGPPDSLLVGFEEKLLGGEYGRLRDVYELPSGQLLVLTNNRDGRGRPSKDDDRMLLVTLE